MKFIICTDTHFFQLNYLLDNYAFLLDKYNYTVVDYKDDYPEEGFDYHTHTGCLIEFDSLEDLNNFATQIEDYLFIDFKKKLIVLTPYYPDN